MTTPFLLPEITLPALIVVLKEADPRNTPVSILYVDGCANVPAASVPM